MNVRSSKDKRLVFPLKEIYVKDYLLTEYIISCCGAHKGVVDTVVWTLDVRFLMRVCPSNKTHCCMLDKL